MKLRLEPEPVEVPDEVGASLLREQAERDAPESYYAQLTFSIIVRFDDPGGWSYEVKVPARWVEDAPAPDEPLEGDPTVEVPFGAPVPDDEGMETEPEFRWPWRWRRRRK